MAQAFRKDEIIGWGADLDPRLRPAVPKEKIPKSGTLSSGLTPSQQIMRVPIFHSLERGAVTHVFGSACPPRGLSGILRRWSYEKFGEGRMAHWLILLLADRIDVVEGIVADVKNGRIPLLLQEYRLRWGLQKVDQKTAVRKAVNVLVVSAVVLIAYRVLRSQRQS